MPLPGDLATVLTTTPVQTSAYTANPGEYVRTDTTGGSFTVTLPAAPQASTVVGVKQVAVTSPNVTTIACSGADAFNRTGGGTTMTLTLSSQGAQFTYKSGVWLITSDDLPLSQLDLRYAPYGSSGAATFGSTAALNATLGTYALDSYAGTDDQKMTSALSAVFTAGGGTIVLSARAHTFANQWATAWNAATATPLRITGAVSMASTDDIDGISAYSGVTTVAMSYAGAGVARMDFRHIGVIEITGILFQDSGGSAVPFFQTTNATPNIHDNAFIGSATGRSCFQDAILLGGTGRGGDYSAPDSIFQGYGADIRRNHFRGIRRAVTLQAAANAVVIRDNTIAIQCGDSAIYGAPFVFNANSTFGAEGAQIDHNLVEMQNYGAVVNGAGGYAYRCLFGPNTTWDSVTCVYANLDSTCSGIAIDTRGYDATFPLVQGASPATVQFLGGNTPLPGSQFCSPVTFTGGSAPLVVRSVNGYGPMGESFLGDRTWLTPVSYGNNPSLPVARISVQPGTIVTDGSVVSGSPYITSATAVFNAYDIGTYVKAGTAVPSGTFIETFFTATSWQIKWTASTAHALGDIVLPSTGNSHMYQCTAAGTTAATQPATWPVSGGTVTDGTVTWTDLGTGITAVQVSANASATATGQTVWWGRPSSGGAVNMTYFNNHHIFGSGTAPTWAAQSAAGSGATCTTSGNDLGQQVTLTTGTGPSAGLLAVGTPGNSMNVAYGTGAGAFSITPRNAAAVALGLWGNFGGNVWNIYCVNAPSGSTQYIFMINTIG